MPKIRKCWCVVDYEDTFILVRAGRQWPNGEVCTDTFIVHTTGFDASYCAWDAFHDWQYGPCPFPAVRAALEELAA